MSSTRTLVFILAAAAAIVGTVLGAQYIGGLQPCELCLYERWPYYAAIAMAALGLVIPGRPNRRAALWILALIFAASSALGLYHVAVEHHWIAGPTACTGALGHAASPAELLKMLEARAPVQCDVVQWSLMGISLAGFNLIASLILLLSAFNAARRRSRR